MWTSLLFVTLLSSVIVYSVSADACTDKSFTSATGDITADAPEKGKSCVFTIKLSGSPTQTAVIFTSLKLGNGFLELIVQSKTDDAATPVLIANLTANPDTTIALSTTNITVITLTYNSTSDTPPPGLGFTASYDSTGCRKEINSARGFLKSGMAYASGIVNVACTFKVNKPNDGDLFVLMFDTFNVPSGQVNVTFDKQATVPFTGTTLPDDQVGAKDQNSFEVIVTFNTSVANQSFTSSYETACGKCSGKLTANTTAVALTLPTTTYPMLCYNQITTKDDDKYVVYVTDDSSQSVVDTLVYYEGLSQRGAVLGSSNAGSSVVLSTGRSLTIVANLGVDPARSRVLKYKEDQNSKFVNIGNTTNTVGPLKGPKPAVYLKFTASLPVVNVVLTATLTAANVTVQDGNGVTQFIFRKGMETFPINVAGGTAIVMIDALVAGENVTVKATALATPDCNTLYNTGSSTIGFPTSTDKPDTCTLSVYSVFPTMIQINSLTQCATSSLVMYQGFDLTKKLATLTGGQATSTAQIWVPAETGIRLVWTNPDKTCAVPTLMGKYWNQDKASACNPVKVDQKGRTVVTTPNFPAAYPLNLNCNWDITTTTTSKLHLSVDSLQLAGTDSIILKDAAGKTVTSFSGNSTTLPGDFLTPINNTTLSLNFAPVNDGSKATLTAQGAQLNYKVINYGDTITKAKGSVSTPDKKGSMEAIWILQVPCTPANGTCVLNVTSFTVKGKKGPKNYLTLHNGNSCRAPEYKETAKLSLSSTMVLHFTYDNSTTNEAPLNFTLKYETYTCVNICKNGLCMHPGWACNGVNDCGDWSDERFTFCNGTAPPITTPTPTPAPITPASAKKGGASAGWLFFCIVLGLVLGVLITLIVPRCIRKVRQRNSGRRSGYDTMHEDA